VLERRGSLGGRWGGRREVAPSVKFTGTPERGVELAAIPIRGRCRHCPLPLATEESSESCPPLLLMGKKSAECFKEKCFTLFSLFFELECVRLAGTIIRPPSPGAEGQRGLLKTLHHSVHAQPNGLVNRLRTVSKV